MDEGFMDSDSTRDRYPPASGATSSVSSSAGRSSRGAVSARSGISDAMRSVRSRNSGHAAAVQAAVDARQQQRELQNQETAARHQAIHHLTGAASSGPREPRTVHLPGPSDHIPHPAAVPTTISLAEAIDEATAFPGLSPADAAAAPPEPADAPAPAATPPHIDDVSPPSYMARVDGMVHPHANLIQALGDKDARMSRPRQQVSPVAVAPGPQITPEMVRSRAIVPYESQVQQTVRRLDQVAEVGSAIGLSLIHI